MTDRDNLETGAELKDTVTSSGEEQNNIPVDGTVPGNSETIENIGTVSGNISSDNVSVDHNDSVDKSVHKGMDNLIPITSRSTEEVREIGRKGGIKSGEVRRKKKHMREIAQAMLAHDMSESQVDEVLGTAKSLLDGDLSVSAVLIARMIQEAADGNYKAFEVLRDTAGYKPKDQVEVENISEADKALLERIAQRVGLHNPVNTNQITG